MLVPLPNTQITQDTVLSIHMYSTNVYHSVHARLCIWNGFLEHVTTGVWDTYILQIIYTSLNIVGIDRRGVSDQFGQTVLTKIVLVSSGKHVCPNFKLSVSKSSFMGYF